MINMHPWPRNAYAVLAVVVVVAGVAMRWLYTETRTAYLAVGLNDGQIQQREQTMTAIARAVPVVNCTQLMNINPPIELLAVKAESLYMAVSKDGAVRFCR
jgi:hypothetical protein